MENYKQIRKGRTLATYTKKGKEQASILSMEGKRHASLTKMSATDYHFLYYTRSLTNLSNLVATKGATHYG